MTLTRIVRNGTAETRPAPLSKVEDLVIEPYRHGRGPFEAALEAARTQGHADGYARGIEEGRRAGQDQAMREFSELLAPALEALEAARDLLVARDALHAEEIEGALMALAVDVAEVLVGHELASVDAPALDAVRRALQLAPQRGDIVVHLSPADMELVHAVAPLAPGRSVEVVADGSVERGGCLLRVGSCTIDAQLAPALERVRTALGANAIADEAAA